MTKIISEKASYRMIWGGLILMVGSIGLFLWKTTLFDFSQPIQADRVAQFGDFVGGVVGAIFSLTGVILFYVALREQRNDFKTNTEILRLQKEELQLQREELIETRKVFEDQSLLMQGQKNDSRFFSLLENHKEMVASFMKGELKFGGGSGFTERLRNSYTEPVSGYEILDGIAEEWKYYFKHYTEAFEKKVILNFKLAEYEGCIDIMKKNTIASLHFRELHNLYLFIQEKLNNDEFYLNTLNVNLTHNERYLFEAAYNNFPAESKGLNYKSFPSYFKKQTLVDFENDQLPIVKAERTSVGENYNWIFIHSDTPLKEVKLIIYSKRTPILYKIEDVVTVEKRSLSGSLLSFEQALVNSNLNIHDFPFYDKDAIRGKNFVFDITMEKNGIEFHFYFKYELETTHHFGSKPLLKHELRNTTISEIDMETYLYLTRGITKFKPDSKVKKPEQPLENKLNTIVEKYFAKKDSAEIIETTILSKKFVFHGIFKESDGNSVINAFLRKLNRNGELEKIPFAFSEKKGNRNKWYFGRNGKPKTI